MLALESLTRRFGDARAVDSLSLTVEEGELLTLLGPSGCGKTTTLRMVAGFENPTSGRVVLQGRDVTRLPPQRRGVGMVFQNYALFPHLDVGENVGFGLRARGVRGGELVTRVERALERVELGGFSRRAVQELSGGQQQRVALARALAPEPPLLLLDEPLSNLDTRLRERTRTELRTLLKELGITTVLVTHDQEEAFAFSDRVALLDAGRLQQAGSPEALYGRPANPFVAAFLGRANFLDARVVEIAGSRVLSELKDGSRWRAETAPGFSPEVGASVRVMVRPEDLRLGAAPSAGAPGGEITGTVVERRFAGAMTVYRVEWPGGEIRVEGAAIDLAPGCAVRIAPASTAAAIAYPGDGG